MSSIPVHVLPVPFTHTCPACGRQTPTLADWPQDHRCHECIVDGCRADAERDVEAVRSLFRCGFLLLEKEQRDALAAKLQESLASYRRWVNTMEGTSTYALSIEAREESFVIDRGEAFPFLD